MAGRADEHAADVYERRTGQRDRRGVRGARSRRRAPRAAASRWRTSSAAREVAAGEVFERARPVPRRRGRQPRLRRAAGGRRRGGRGRAPRPPAPGAATPWAERCALLRAVGRRDRRAPPRAGGRRQPRDGQVARRSRSSRSQEAVDLIDDLRRPHGAQRRLRRAARRASWPTSATPTSCAPTASSRSSRPSTSPPRCRSAWPPRRSSRATPWSSSPPRRRRGPGAILAEIVRRGRLPRRASSTSCTAARPPAARWSTRRVDGVAFTGSAAVGREIVAQDAATGRTRARR